MSNLLEIRALGRLTIGRNGQPVMGFVSQIAKALLVYLACTGQPHRREFMGGTLNIHLKPEGLLFSSSPGLSAVYPLRPLMARRAVRANVAHGCLIAAQPADVESVCLPCATEMAAGNRLLSLRTAANVLGRTTPGLSLTCAAHV